MDDEVERIRRIAMSEVAPTMRPIEDVRTLLAALDETRASRAGERGRSQALQQRAERAEARVLALETEIRRLRGY
jgi:hypothetical protein